jgi:hypothetical protein
MRKSGLNAHPTAQGAFLTYLGAVENSNFLKFINSAVSVIADVHTETYE